MTGTIETRLMELGIKLSDPPKPVASYLPYVQSGNLVFLSGQLPFEDGKLSCTGLLGSDVSEEDGYAAARVCGINILAQIRAACDGDLERVVRCVRLGGFVASTPDFTNQPKIVNGASDLMAEVFGEKGAHARAAVGVASLPLNACVEVEATFEIA